MREEDSRISRRRYVAERILASYAGRATGREVLAEMEREDFDDPVLEELLDLFVHQPGQSFGAGWLWSSDRHTTRTAPRRIPVGTPTGPVVQAHVPLGSARIAATRPFSEGDLLR